MSAHQDLTAAAKNVIENNLDAPDLSPEMIARTLKVSLRTLHRHFAKTGEPVMAFTRRRRMQEAHDDLVRSKRATAVSEVAARWRFSDASHFIRSFKSHYGMTPAAYLRNNGRY